MRNYTSDSSEVTLNPGKGAQNVGRSFYGGNTMLDNLG